MTFLKWNEIGMKVQKIYPAASGSSLRLLEETIYKATEKLNMEILNIFN